MTIFLGSDDIRRLASSSVVVDAARAAVEAQRLGTTVLPPRLDVSLSTGFLRVMPAALDDIMGVKVMALTKGRGTRYLLLVYRQEDGSLEAILDAEQVTQLRTAATTFVAGEILHPGGVSQLGLIGSGFEAAGHLELFVSSWPIERVIVYSPSLERRTAFARRMSEQLSVQVEPVESVDRVCSAVEVVILATKSTIPVVAGDSFMPGATVLSIGSTRPDLRELDRRTLERTRLLVVDDVEQVLRESGDIIDALSGGAIEEERIVDLGECAERLATDGRGVGEGEIGRDLTTFKSVGAAIQDLALGRALVQLARECGCGSELGDLARLKPFAAEASG